MDDRLITIASPCFNEENNVEEMYRQIRDQFDLLDGYDFVLMFIDNASTDRTVEKIRSMSERDKRVRAIVNTRNFGPIRSPYHGLLNSTGDATIFMASDLQDPTYLIPELIERWEEGNKIVAAVKTRSHENPLIFLLRKLYYRTLAKMSDAELIENFMGFGLYDKCVIQTLREYDDPYPYVRGLISETGYSVEKVEYTQPVRQHGKSNASFYTLVNQALLGLTNHSRVPLRLATIFGFIFAVINFLVGLIYLIYKLIMWDQFSLGMAPVVIGLFFFASVQLTFVGIIGEYVGAILTRVQNKPHVIEKERINFPEE